MAGKGRVQRVFYNPKTGRTARKVQWARDPIEYPRGSGWQLKSERKFQPGPGDVGFYQRLAARQAAVGAPEVAQRAKEAREAEKVAGGTVHTLAWHQKQIARKEPERVTVTPSQRGVRAVPREEIATASAEISRKFPELSGEDALAAAYGERTYGFKAKDADTARELARLHRYEREMTPAEAVSRRKGEYVQEEKAREVSKREFNDWINTEANSYLRNAYRSGGIESFNRAVQSQQGIVNELKRGGFVNDAGEYNLVAALDAGFPQYKLRRVFKDDAVDKAAATLSASKKLEAAGGSPTWALGMGKMEPEELELVMGSDASAKYVSEFKEFAKANNLLNTKSGSALDRAHASIISTQFSFAAGAEKLATEVGGLRAKGIAFYNSIPDKGVWGTIQQGAIKLPVRFLSGAAMAGAGAIGVVTFVTGIPTHLSDPSYISSFKSSVARSFVDIGKGVLVDPVGGTAEVAGLILGPAGTIKLARALAVKGSPYYIPNTGTRFTFSTGKLPMKWGEVGVAIKAGKITEVQVANAIGRVMNRAMKNPTARATAQIGRTNIRVYIEPTPVSAKMGGALWRASPSKEGYKSLEHVVEVAGKEPAEFYSLQAAPRFAMSSASGVRATSPALIMVYTKTGKLRTYPSSVQYATSLSQMRQKGFAYLGSGKAKPGAYAPIKTYGIGFELEAMLPNGMKVFRVQNLRSRLLGAGAGEFVTTVDGFVLPIFRFAEKGATIPKVGVSELAAIRINSVVHGIRALLGKKGFGAEAGYASVRTLTKQLDTIGRLAMSGLKGSVAERAYQDAISKDMTSRITAIYKKADPRALETAWRNNPDAFENAYVEYIFRGMEKAYPSYRVDPEAFRSGTSYTRARVGMDNRLLETRAREFEYEVKRLPSERQVGRVGRGRIAPEVTTRRIVGGRESRITRDGRIARDIDIRETTIRRIIEKPDERRITTTTTVTPPPPTVALTRPQAGSVAQPVPAGSIAWRQGLFWKYIPPPWTQDKPITLKRGVTPMGAVNTHLRKAEETVQMIGRSRTARVPEKISVDSGAVDIFVSGGGRYIRYVWGGERTDVGKSLSSTTMGMTIGGIDGGESADRWLTEIEEPFPGRPVSDTPIPRAQGISRPAMSKRKPPRKGKRKENWLDVLTSLKGFRP